MFKGTRKCKLCFSAYNSNSIQQNDRISKVAKCSKSIENIRKGKQKETKQRRIRYGTVQTEN